MGHLYAWRLRFWWLQHQNHLPVFEERKEVQVSWEYVAESLLERDQGKFDKEPREKWETAGNIGKCWIKPTTIDCQ